MRILVVDDEPKILRFVRLMLHTFGFEVLLASGGEQALKMAEEEHPDLMILDIFMPDPDGFEVLRRRRSLEEKTACAQLPIIAFSAHNSIAGQALELGANDFIGKPFLPEELARKVKGLVGGAK